MAAAQGSVQAGKVKSVLSGDTLVLMGRENPHAERTLSMAYVSAPRMRREGDEPFAFESRDFIRKLLVGKVVQFQVLYTNPAGNKREYGIIRVQDGRLLPEIAVAEGWLKLRDDAGKREDADDNTVEKLKALEARAKADSKGMWSTDNKVEASHELSDPKSFVEKHKGTQLDAIVEKVLTGDRLIVRLMESPTKHIQTMLLIAGIRTPSTKKVNPSDGSEQPGEPFGDEAQFFVEFRLLQRNVKVELLGVSPQNQLIATVLHPMGNIANFVLEAGLARCVDHHSTILGTEMTPLRQAEQGAKDKKLGIFKGHVTKKPAAGNQTDVVVSRIQSADTLFLRYPNGSEKRVNLSSIRQPKPTDPKQSPFGAEAKEFLRRTLIGKHVKVNIDGKRPATEGFDEREMVTLVSNNKNVALMLVQNGFATVLRHKMDDPDRSPAYDDLLAAEVQAQTEEKGMWSPKPPEAKQYVDYSESLEKAKRLLTLLSRQKRVPAIVDFVKGGSRFTLLIPRENAKITFVLSGIQAPRSARNAQEASEPFGREAHDLASKRLQQRDVEIDVEDNDRVGGFIGKLYINRDNFAKILLEEGFASVRGYSAEKSGNANELFQAEQKAKDARKGLWQDYDPSQEEAGLEDDSAAVIDADIDAPTGGSSATVTNGANGASSNVNLSKDYRDVVVTHIDETTGHLKIQPVTPSTTGALQTLTTALRQLHLSNAAPKALTTNTPPKAGDIVAAKFSADGQWYRARVRRNDRDKQTAEVLYIDYGNSESLPWSQLRPLGSGAASAGATDEKFGLGKLKAVAADAKFSFVQFPVGSKEYMDEAALWISQRCVEEGRQMVARVDFDDQKAGTLFITLFDAEAVGSGAGKDDSINAELVEEGLAMVGRKLTRWEKGHAAVLEGLKKREADAKEGRRGMWEYGDLTED